MDREKKKHPIQKKTTGDRRGSVNVFYLVVLKINWKLKKKKKKTQKEQNKKNQIQINWEHLKCLIMIRDKRHV